MDNHIHIPFPGGHITWTGKNAPTAKELAAFEKLIAAARKLCRCKNKTTETLNNSNSKLWLSKIKFRKI